MSSRKVKHWLFERWSGFCLVVGPAEDSGQCLFCPLCYNEPTHMKVVLKCSGKSSKTNWNNGKLSHNGKWKGSFTKYKEELILHCFLKSLSKAFWSGTRMFINLFFFLWLKYRKSCFSKVNSTKIWMDLDYICLWQCVVLNYWSADPMQIKNQKLVDIINFFYF